MVRSGVFVIVMLGVLSGDALASQDPTAPLGWQAPVKQPSSPRARLPQLEGIVCDELGSCTAILNDVPAEPGQRIRGYTLTEIKDDHVTVTRGGKTWRLELFADIVKTN